MGILIDCKMLCLPLPLFLLSPVSGIGVLPRMPVVVTRDNGAVTPLLQPECKTRAGFRPPRSGEGPGLVLPPNESARWNGGVFNHMCVGTVLEKTFPEVLVCSMGARCHLCGPPLPCETPAIRVIAVLGVSVGLIR